MPKKLKQGDKAKTLEGLLKELREGFGLTQSGLAKIMGEDVSYIINYETGKRRLDLGDLVHVALHLDLDLTTILLLYVEWNEGKKRVVPEWWWDPDMF